MSKNQFYQATVTYKDDKTVNLIIPNSMDKKVFFENLKQGHVCMMDEEKSVGFWSKTDDVRHVIVQPFIPKETQEEAQEETK